MTAPDPLVDGEDGALPCGCPKGVLAPDCGWRPSDSVTVPGEGIDLSPQELRVLVLRLLALQAMSSEWPEWGDLPELSERSFLLLTDVWSDLAQEMLNRSGQADQEYGLDSESIHERCS